MDAAFVMGDRRNADGEGIEIVAIELRKGFKLRNPKCYCRYSRPKAMRKSKGRSCVGRWVGCPLCAEGRGNWSWRWSRLATSG